MHKKKLRDIWRKKEEQEEITRILKGSTTILDDINTAIDHLNIELKQTDLDYIGKKITKQEGRLKDVATNFRFMQLLLKYVPKDGSISKIKVMTDLDMLSNTLVDIKETIENPVKLKGDLRIFVEYFLPLNTAKEEEILSILLNPKIEEFWKIQALFCKIPSSFNGKLSIYPTGIDPTQTMLMDNFLQLITGSDNFSIRRGLEVPQIKQKEVFGYKKQIGEVQKQKFQEILEFIGFEFTGGKILPNMHFWKKYQVYNLITIERNAENPRVHLNFSDQTLYQIYLCQVLVKREFTSELMTWFAIILAWLTFLLHWYTKLSENNIFDNLYGEKFFSRMFICRFAKTVALRQFNINSAQKIHCGELQMNDQVFDAATSQLDELKSLVARFITRRHDLENIEDNLIDRIEELFLNDLFPIATNQNQTIFLRSLKRDCASYFANSKTEAINAPEVIEDVKSYLTTKIHEAEKLSYITPTFSSRILKAFDSLRY